MKGMTHRYKSPYVLSSTTWTIYSYSTDEEIEEETD